MMDNSKIVSPLNFTKNIKRVAEFPVSEILKRYKEYGIEVSSYFQNISTVELYECLNTGYRFYWPYSVVGDAAFYENLSANKPNYYSNRWEHKIALRKLTTNETVLEVGSGFGAFLNLLNENGISGKGLELNPHAVKECKGNGLTVEKKLIEAEAMENPGKFDVVCYFQVLEHITEVHSFIDASVKLIKKGGKLMIGVPNNNPYLFINDKYHTLNLPPHHAGLWNRRSIKSLEKVFNIKLVSLQYEPLEKTYNQFLKTYIKNSNPAYSKLLKTVNRMSPKVLRKILCKCINGRNILVVFRKLS